MRPGGSDPVPEGFVVFCFAVAHKVHLMRWAVRLPLLMVCVSHLKRGYEIQYIKERPASPNQFERKRRGEVPGNVSKNEGG